MSKVWDALVARSLVDKITFMQFRGVVTAPMFKDTMLAQLWSLVGTFFDKYKKVPSMDEMVAWLRTMSASERERAKDYIAEVRRLYEDPPRFDPSVLREEAVAAVRQFMVEQMLLDGSAMHEAGRIDYDGLMSTMKDILTVSVDTSLGVELNARVGETIATITADDQFDFIKTGIRGLDRIIGGFKRGQFACGIAPSGVGKSTFLVNHAVAAARQGRNVLLLTVELEDFRVAERVVRRIAKMGRKELRVGQVEAGRWVERFFRMSGSRLFIKYARPNSFTVDDLYNYLDRLHAIADFEPELVAIDYLDEMRSSADDRRKDTRHQHSGIARDLTGLAKERQNSVVTETQTNRAALGKRKLTEKDVGEDYGKVKIADLNYAICQTDDEYKTGQARVRILKNRDGWGKGREVPVLVDYDRMLVESMEPKVFEEED